jgi:hypothetical protein
MLEMFGESGNNFQTRYGDERRCVRAVHTYTWTDSAEIISGSRYRSGDSQASGAGVFKLDIAGRF